MVFTAFLFTYLFEQTSSTCQLLLFILHLLESIILFLVLQIIPSIRQYSLLHLRFTALLYNGSQLDSQPRSGLEKVPLRVMRKTFFAQIGPCPT